MERNCNVCGQVYHAEARYVNRGQGLTCGRACGKVYASEVRARNNPSLPNTKCFHCSAPLHRKQSALKKTDIFFCDKECQVAAQRAGTFQSNLYKGGICNLCGGRTGRNNRGAPIATHSECLRQDNIRRWLAGDNSVTLYVDSKSGLPRDTKRFVKKYLLETRGDRCEVCGFDEKAPDGRSIIQMDHINGNCFDNRPENLRLLCPNHHAMTPTYGSRNKGSGRAHRRKQV